MKKDLLQKKIFLNKVFLSYYFSFPFFTFLIVTCVIRLLVSSEDTIQATKHNQNRPLIPKIYLSRSFHSHTNHVLPTRRHVTEKSV